MSQFDNSFSLKNNLPSNPFHIQFKSAVKLNLPHVLLQLQAINEKCTSSFSAELSGLTAIGPFDKIQLNGAFFFFNLIQRY